MRVAALAMVLVACAPPPAKAPRPPRLAAVTAALEALGGDAPDLAVAKARIVEARAEGSPAALVAAAERLLVVVADQQRDEARLREETVDLERRLEATERALLDIQQRYDETSTLAQLLREERVRTMKRVEELEARLEARNEQLRELREELEALKKIDMDRSP
ncbi:MAG: hypothetical protein R3B72_08885 [Polyangiaceae bacterium]